MFSSQPTGQPSTQSGWRPVLSFLFFGGAMFSLFLLIPLFLLASPYHAIREQAAQFSSAPVCHDVAATGDNTAPCSIEWANVVFRDYRSTRSNSKSGANVRYYLRLRGGYGDLHQVELKNADVFWRTRVGDAVKLQRWGDKITAVLLTTGEASATAQNPEWQLRNDVRGLHTIVIFEIVMVAITIMSAIGLRELAA